MRILFGFLLGFLFYPLVFVPLLSLWPEGMNWWINTYANYLRLLGF